MEQARSAHKDHVKDRKNKENQEALRDALEEIKALRRSVDVLLVKNGLTQPSPSPPPVPVPEPEPEPSVPVVEKVDASTLTGASTTTIVSATAATTTSATANPSSTLPQSSPTAQPPTGLQRIWAVLGY